MIFKDNKHQVSFLWAMVAVVPLLLMAVSFCLDHWSWGLMDDVSLLQLPGQGWWDKTISYFHSLQSWGTFRFTYAAYGAFFYSLFHTCPKLFYFFKWVLVTATLLIWGNNARMLTGQLLAVFLVPAITLSFYFFYDAFEYLSVQEPLGLFFGGLALMCFIVGIVRRLESRLPIHTGWMATGCVLLVVCVQCKEVFISSAMAFAVLIAACGVLYKRKSLWMVAAGIFAAAFFFAIYLKVYFQHGYSSRYDLSNLPHIMFNFNYWRAHSLVFHLPWIALALVAVIGQGVKKIKMALPAMAWVGILTGVVNYLLFLALLLPWQVSDFYAIPLGLFFAFTITLYLAPVLQELSGWPAAVILIGALVLNTAVCCCSFGKMVTFRNDTYYLLDWLHYNEDFNSATAAGMKTATNAPEAGVRITQLLQIQTGKNIPYFSELDAVKDIVYDPKTLYYLYSPAVGDQDLRAIPQLFSVVYSSHSWTLFRKNAVFFSH